MLSHALTILANELEAHLTANYGAPTVAPQVRLGNIAEGIGNGNQGAVLRDVLNIAMVNIREEKALRNVSGNIIDGVNHRLSRMNPPAFLNFLILISATHSNYNNALLVLSRAIRFFQARNFFDQTTVAPASIATNAPPNVADQLRSFKLILDLHSPSLEEVNHLWGTLGGKQYPFILYDLRMLELQFCLPVEDESLVLTVKDTLVHKHDAA